MKGRLANVSWEAVINHEDNFSLLRTIVTKQNMNSLDFFGLKAVAVAISAKAYRCLRLLIEMRADVHFKLTDKSTMLHWIVSSCTNVDTYALGLLLQLKRIPIDARDKFGRSPLHLALIHHRNDHAKMLLEAGANPRLLTGSHNESCLDLYCYWLPGLANITLTRQLVFAGVRWLRLPTCARPADLIAYRQTLATCKLASRALGRALKWRGYSRDICQLLEEAVWALHVPP